MTLFLRISTRNSRVTPSRRCAVTVTAVLLMLAGKASAPVAQAGSVGNQVPVQWGWPGDVPVAADYNGDGVTDVAVYRPSTGQWFVRNQFTVQWGWSEDVPVPDDYNGDGVTDVAVYRPTDGIWYVRNQFSVQWGAPDDIPAPGDYHVVKTRIPGCNDGNGVADVA